MEAMENKETTKPSPEIAIPKAGQLVIAQFTEDNKWYRAKIDSISAGGITVFYVDYGNLEILHKSRIRQIDSSFTTLPFQARESFLAYLQPPTLEDEWGQDAALFFKDLVWGKKLKACVEYRDDKKRFFLSILEWSGDKEQQNVHVNLSLARAGLARVVVPMNVPENTKLITKLQEEQEQAKKGKLYMWKYGNIYEDDI